MRPDELYHWGILGMKWGVRRFQNEDGSLTPEGRERYLRSSRDNDKKKDGFTSAGERLINKSIKKKYGNVEKGILSNSDARKSYDELMNNKVLKNAIDTDNGASMSSAWGGRNKDQTYINAIYGQYYKMLDAYFSGADYRNFYSDIGFTKSQWNSEIRKFIRLMDGEENAEIAYNEMNDFIYAAKKSYADLIIKEAKANGMNEVLKNHKQDSINYDWPSKWNYTSDPVNSIINSTWNNLAFFNNWYSRLDV